MKFQEDSKEKYCVEIGKNNLLGPHSKNEYFFYDYKNITSAEKMSFLSPDLIGIIASFLPEGSEYLDIYNKARVGIHISQFSPDLWPGENNCTRLILSCGIDLSILKQVPLLKSIKIYPDFLDTLETHLYIMFFENIRDYCPHFVEFSARECILNDIFISEMSRAWADTNIESFICVNGEIRTSIAPLTQWKQLKVLNLSWSTHQVGGFGGLGEVLEKFADTLVEINVKGTSSTFCSPEVSEILQRLPFPHLRKLRLRPFIGNSTEIYQNLKHLNSVDEWLSDTDNYLAKEMLIPLCEMHLIEMVIEFEFMTLEYDAVQCLYAIADNSPQMSRCKLQIGRLKEDSLNEIFKLTKKWEYLKSFIFVVDNYKHDKVLASKDYNCFEIAEIISGWKVINEINIALYEYKRGTPMRTKQISCADKKLYIKGHNDFKTLIDSIGVAVERLWDLEFE